MGLQQIADGLWHVYYRDILLRHLDEKQMCILDDKGSFRRAKRKVYIVFLESCTQYVREYEST
jgi:hypothetical protein